MSPEAARIHAALPQTQCTRCGYPDCAGYAQALADDAAPLNQCPPGGAAGIARLAQLTGRPVLALNPAHGVEAPRTVAVIDEAWCIGCTLCLDACPTDAILGANKRMHTVIEPWCTGCELCIPACPVDCIALENVSDERSGWAAWSDAQAAQALQRYQVRTARLAREKARTESPGLRPDVDPVAPGTQPAPTTAADISADGRKRSVVEAALARARAQRKAN